MPNITLKRFMIFNSSEGRQEGREGDKLIYHWAKEAPDFKTSLEEQIDDICLCDASVNVSNRLNCAFVDGQSPQLDDEYHDGTNEEREDSYQAPQETSSSSNGGNNCKTKLKKSGGNSLVLNFDSTLVLIVEIEQKQSIWMAVHIAPPSSIPATDSSSEVGSNQSPSNQQTDPACIPTDAIERVMNNIYTRFCLLNGTFQMIADSVKTNSHKLGDENNGEKIRALIRNQIRSTCESYFGSVLSDLHLNSIVSNVASLYNYILYLDLHPLTLMKVNSFINHLVCVDAIRIRHTIVIFNDQLLWSSLNMYDTRLLYNYLVSVLIRTALQEELSKEVDKVRRIEENLPIYLTDEQPIIDNDIYTISDTHENELTDLLKASRLTKLYLTVFRSSNNMTVGLIFSEPNLVDLTQKCEQILINDSRLGVIPLASLAQSVGQSFLKANSPPGQQQYSPSGSSQSQQPGTSAASLASGPNPSWRRPSSGSSTSRNIIPPDQKYIFMDRLDVSISWPINIDMQNKEHLMMGSLDISGHEIQSNSKKFRLIKYLIDLEPELRELKQQTGSRVEEFFGRTLSDSWLTVTNSKYRTIYSVHNVRNSGLSEAQQSAINLKSIFVSSRQ